MDNSLVEIEKEKIKMESNMKNLLTSIDKYSNHLEVAILQAEKEKTHERIKNLEMAYNQLRRKYEKKYHLRPSLGCSSSSSSSSIDELEDSGQEEVMESLSKKYPGLKYNVDDPEVRKEIGYSLSYDSGYSGYTEKEAQEIKALLE